ncbi:hypothetical protein B0T26DRAFT_748650 [Lasiosphaeria miniovina]|uniref:Uncharacterized protein n=1 Tax=Lasiosphaeria miniovina TaxID=1954250 RepID=A0AA40B674_9PEZI|nr:uncharacterized protein B0T26DRAFT_748650 [Lasiosphaeria miniovina]KAK0728427.1 hypothetical protein B0T26DRAFT_748650 [Lasiosphaeria miniovina]
MSFVSNYPPAGSMTRVFTPPCGPITNAGYGPSSFIGEHGHANYASSCGPPGWLDRNAGEFSVGYFSPAICPAGYTAACTWYDVAQGPAPAAGTETAMNCLPSGYACNTAVLRHGTLTAAALGDKKRQEGASTLTEAPYFFIRWRAQDLSVFETHPLSPGVYLVNGIPESTSVSTPTSSSSATTGPITSPSKSSSSSSSSSTAIQTDTLPPPSSPSSSSSLSTGAIAGIAVGAIGGVALIAAAAVFVWLRKRRAAAQGTHPAVPELHDPKAVPELDAPPQGGGLKELAAVKDPLDPQELALTAAAAELPTERHDQSTPAELSAATTSPATRAAYHLSTPSDSPGHGSGQGNDPWTPSPVASTSSPNTATTATATTTTAYIPTPPPWAPETEPLPGPPPALVSDGGSGFEAAHDDELAELRARKAEIDAKRQRLLQLQQLDDEEQGLQRRMRELASGGNRGGSGSGSRTGAGMGG